MDKLNFIDFEENLLKDCKSIISRFAANDDNKGVYAFVIFSNATYGEIIIYWNTVDSFNNYVDKHYPQYTYKQVYGAEGLMFSVGDFSFQAYDFSEETEEFIKKYISVIESELEESEWWHYYNSLIKTQINVINRLNNDFQLFNKTGDFIAYAIDSDKWDDALMSMTVPENVFKQVFPGLAYPPKVEL